MVLMRIIIDIRINIKSILAATIIAWAFSGTANASLTTIGTATYNGISYKLIYDNDSPFGTIVYLDYTHSGLVWAEQMAWAASLNSAGVLTYSLNRGVSVNWSGNWRLPNTVVGAYNYGYNGTTSGGYNVTTSELGHLYYSELGNKGFITKYGENINTEDAFSNKGPFANLQTYSYWSGATCTQIEYFPYGSGAWFFNIYSGFQGGDRTDGFNLLQGIAARNAMVESSTGTQVPVMEGLWLLPGVLAGLGLFARRRKE